MPFVFAVGGSNITIKGGGTIDAAGRYWWDSHRNHSDGRIGRPHLLELQSIDGVELTGVTLLNSGFWTFHPVYCKDVHIHDMTILNPDYKPDDYVQLQDPRLDQGEGAPNGDGIDVDSCQNVLIENNYISCGDDHVTILSGTNGKGPPCKNVTVRHNKLGTGMGLSVGSSVAGGVEDVLYQHNWMNQSAGGEPPHPLPCDPPSLIQPSSTTPNSTAPRCCPLFQCRCLDAPLFQATWPASRGGGVGLDRSVLRAVSHAPL